jgi:excisionase family DNA binding protein
MQQHLEVETGRVLTKNQAAQYLGLSLRTLERMIMSGDAPKRIQRTQKRYGFRLSDLMKWVETRPSVT